MADTQIRGLGTGSAPLSYSVPGSQEIILKSLFASFDGSAAATFLPCVRIVAPGGGVVAEYITDSAVAAGSSAEVTFAPFLRGAASGATPSGIPSLSVATVFSGTAASPRAWDGIITNDASLYSIDGGDSTKFRIASQAVYMFILRRDGAQIVPVTPLRWTLALLDNSDFSITSATPIDVEPVGGSNPQINNLTGSCVLDPQGDADTPYYVRLADNLGGAPGTMVLHAIRLSPTVET